MDKRKYVLDTSTVVADPQCIYKFDEHEVIIPIVVVQELDGLKKGNNEAGKNARMASRILTELCDKYGGLTDSVVINDKGGTLRVAIKWNKTGLNGTYGSQDLQLNYSDEKLGNDNKIINTAYINDAILVTKDNNVRIIAISYGVKAEDYKNEKVSLDDLYTGITNYFVSDKTIDEIYVNGYILLQSVDKLYPNQCLVLKSNSGSQQSALGIYDAKNNNIRLVPKIQKYYEIQPKNMEQKFFFDLLLDPDIKLLTATGKPGTGKTLAAAVLGLYQTMELHMYKKVIVTRSPMAIDKDTQLGFLPGSLISKLLPWMGSLLDNLDYVMGRIKTTDKKKTKTRSKNKDLDDDKDIGITNSITELIEYGNLELLSLEHVRGRSLRDSFVILDEAQNINPHILKTIVTRIGENSKLVLLGDINQVDAPYLDSSNNGLVYCIDKMKGQDIFAQIHLSKSERSKLAELADKLL